MSTLTPEVAAARARVAGLLRHPGAVDPDVIDQARRALALASTESTIRKAIEAAPPLDQATLDRLRSLIPAGPTGGER